MAVSQLKKTKTEEYDVEAEARAGRVIIHLF